jgi:hypothetical protein
MIKKTITYEDFNGKQQTEEFYFNLSKSELTEMETSVDGGMSEMLKQIVKTQNVREILGIFKKIIVASVGVKSEDGRRFIKNEAIAQDFLASPAFDEMFMSMMEDSNKAAEFVKGIMPKDLADQLDTEMVKNEVSPE